ncbi:MAG: hypothetical protein HYZ57_17535, partial [Acidobacteria bacterium]|nr:hypothetical protein [Acidobacteriota bacterium]
MDLTLVVTFVVLLVAAAAAWIYMTRRRSERLRGRFGPEYDRALHEAGDQRRAESLLEKREQRVQKFQIRHLTDEEKHRCAEAWLGEQARFVDDPPGAVLNADTLVNHVMRTRGYPMAEFEQRAEDL